ncbi:dihydrolipoyl dehydrogenase [Companilactobacillus pabuli]|jgi:dihydrolipoamide dehydrogenase|uniref:Dihydrolipoyl dehydrogenase n=1 Tax=Companilactobacillus pabuli TaxID=2714036 RepID=A0A7L7KVJ3_9LACO|nr:dihydrolipoyl dehydrogenase [Companilactobacillus pabuli]AKP04089.1 dihydrolipoamide dehydrogenase [Companilactobacillus farciminis]AKS52394.1 dihydrolipoamide dehydrogenase [Companilactobacillus farciminis]MDG5113359.1 dihydrolipoyl dehydrogenase [Companilactobacillus pabuli]QMT83843.1 dihydrolipoyl dehydrogenase [Companilactobacillus pabuli]GAQ01348.1 dihydrolipoamide dehydrogenase [Companilactobacillus farciminis]
MAENVIEKDTVIIGSGPGGYVAAIRASELGQDVTVIEKSDTVGGVCLNVGCVPSKALITAGHRLQQAKDSSTYGITTSDATIDFTKTQAWKDEKVVARMTNGVQMLLKKHHVELINGEAYLDSDTQLRVMPSGPRQFMDNGGGQTIKFKNLILATGSRPIEIRGFKFDDRVIDSTGGLNLKEVPKEFIIIGGGYVGTELAGAYADLGAHVTILEGSPNIIPNFEKDMVSIVKKNLEKKGVTIITNAMAKKSENKGDHVDVTYEVDGTPTTISADYCMVTVGRRPNTDNFGLEMTNVKTTDRGLVEVDEQGKTSVDHIYAIGDITPGPALAHKAFFEAKTAAGAISGKNTANDYIGVPAVCFTDPELASVGLTEKDAKDKGIDVKVAKFPFAGNARAVSLDAAEGFVKLIAQKDTGTLLGGQIVGPGASDLISELSVAINCQLNAEDIALTIHPHPTLGEPIQEAADILIGYPTHI